MVVVALWMFAIKPVPLTKVQVPCAGAAGALAAMVVEVVGKQYDWSGPALEPLTVWS